MYHKILLEICATSIAVYSLFGDLDEMPIYNADCNDSYNAAWLDKTTYIMQVYLLYAAIDSF
jgi:hypothetical protein